MLAIFKSTKKTIHLKDLSSELTIIISLYNSFYLIFNDNQSAQMLASNPVFHNKTKHIDVNIILSEKLLKINK